MVVHTYGQPEHSMPPAGRGRGGIKIVSRVDSVEIYEGCPISYATSHTHASNISKASVILSRF